MSTNHCRSRAKGTETPIPDDAVEKPGHYTAGDVECIDAIRAALVGVTDPFVGFCCGNAMKYIWRHALKGKPGEDLRKAQVYLDWAVDELERQGR